MRSHSIAVATLLSSCLASTAIATAILAGPTATFAPGGATITSFTMTLGIGGTPLNAGTTVTLNYTNAAGAPIPPPLTARVGPGGVLTVPQPPIPPGAAPLGSSVVIDEPTFGPTKPVIWYNAAWLWGITPRIKIDPAGLPTPGGTQHWFFDLSSDPVSMIQNSSELGSRSLIVSEGAMDLHYSPSSSGGNLFDVNITGDHSFLQLSEQTYLGLPDGMFIGQIELNPLATSGAFNLSGLGLSGSWQYSLELDYTGAIVFPTGGFDAPTISAVPAPGAGMLAAVGSGLLAAFGRRRRA